jgi:hypothetical protein
MYFNCEMKKITYLVPYCPFYDENVDLHLEHFAFVYKSFSMPVSLIKTKHFL